jgi:hypothetical protein
MSVQRPVANASGTVVNAALKYERVTHPSFAGAAVMTGAATVDRSGQIRGAPDRNRPSEGLFHARAQSNLGAGHRHWRLKLSVGEFRNLFGLTAHSDVLLDQVVIRREIRVGDGPVLAFAVERSAFQILSAEPIALTRPHIGATANEAESSLPAEWLIGRRRVGLLQVVGEPVGVVFGAGVAVGLSRPGLAEHLVRQVRVGQIERPAMFAKVVGTMGRPASTRATLTPASHKRFAAQPPEAPEPTTMTSYERSVFCAIQRPQWARGYHARLW